MPAPKPKKPPTHAFDVLQQAPSSRLIRVFLRSPSIDRPEEESLSLLQTAMQQAMALHSNNLLLTGAGFFSMNSAHAIATRLPSDAEFAIIEAEAHALAVRIQHQLPTPRPTIVTGIDIYAYLPGAELGDGVGQFAAVLPADGTAPTVVRKGYPTSSEVAFVNIADPIQTKRQAVVATPHGPAAVLVCHDLNAYSPRGEVTAKRSERLGWRQAIRDEIEGITPPFGLHLAHYLATPKSFRAAYNAWGQHVGSPLFGASQFPTTVTLAEARALADALTHNPDEWPILDLCETA